MSAIKNNIQSFIVYLLEEIKERMEAECCEEKVPLNYTLVMTVKIEVLIFNSIINKADKSIYQRLMEKYDELMLKTYELQKELVVLGIVEEGDYLDHCSKSVKRRAFIESFCERAEKGKYDNY